ncbi:hypothetical protein M2119_000139 [Aurantimicrobium minutum]|uniref:hypothetical protein n=1 Tax=Aurantimicrobium minutum TaxID=708131 RepID=UPI002476276D|nr:hypothetical protein [Aurantimicrobium minutum]MDH6531902.1 hypothetical protein [Aurantimicrobium minutum]
MPTARQRHMITETAPIERALDEASALWPEVASERSKLLQKILSEGIEAVHLRVENKKLDRERAIREIAGSMNGVWPLGWREELLNEWPE